MHENKWYEVENIGGIPSPALLVFPDRIKKNIQIMLEVAGSPERLRPHVKTYKMSEVVRLQQEKGIHKFKCATIAEAEMLAGMGVKDVLLAYPPVGPTVPRLIALAQMYPETLFSALADSEPALRQLSREFQSAGRRITVFLDINNGMNRTGVPPQEEADLLYRLLCLLPGILPGGLHVYDGHLREKDLLQRTARCDVAFEPVQVLIERLRGESLPVPAVVAGGSPTFPIHARRPDVELSPGTTLLWDDGYDRSLEHPGFLPAALLATRVVSKPGRDLLCLDLGHKAVASEMPHPRVRLFGLEEALPKAHSEEHLVLQAADTDCWSVGDVVYGIPTHICPTVCRYDFAWMILDHQATGQWRIEAQNRQIVI